MASMASRRRAKSTVDTESFLNWRAQSGIDKQGDEDTVDDWSDEEGPPDTYYNRRVRKDGTLLIRGHGDRLRAELQDYLQDFYGNIHVADPKDGPDGCLYYAVTGVSDIGDFIRTVENSGFGVSVRASHGENYDATGLPIKSSDVAIVYNPKNLVEDYFAARNYTRKNAFSLALFVAGSVCVYVAWSDISRYFYASDLIIAAFVVTALVTQFLLGHSRHALVAMLWAALFMAQCHWAGASSLLPATWDFSRESMRFWASDVFLAIATVLFLAPLRRPIATSSLADGLPASSRLNTTGTRRKER